MKSFHLLLTAVLLTSAGCHPGPIINTSPEPRPPADGTIAGIVSTETKAPVAGRKVTATDIDTGATYAATTATNGGYTIKVPQGTYRLEVELLEGETLAREPGQTRINRSDVDSGRHFVIAVRRMASFRGSSFRRSFV